MMTVKYEIEVVPTQRTLRFLKKYYRHDLDISSTLIGDIRHFKIEMEIANVSTGDIAFLKIDMQKWGPPIKGPNCPRAGGILDL